MVDQQIEVGEDMPDFSFCMQFIENYGGLATLVVFIFVILQCHIPVMPFAVLAGICGFLFGFTEGAFLSWISVILGCFIAFNVYRFFRLHNLTNKLLDRYSIKTKLKDKLVVSFIIISHNIPFIPIAIVNILSAISEIKLSRFIIATALGLLFPSLLFAGFGAGVGAFVNNPGLVTFIPLLVIAATIILYKQVDFDKWFYKSEE